MRHRLDSVRRAENRPIVGLVLSGGGAKGAAEVGAMKYIEELGIPIDFVCGTSIGGLVGGIYSMGYNASELENLFRTRDWSVMLTDRIAPQFIPYTNKMERATYQLTVPFHYAKDPVESRRVRTTFRERQRGLPASERVRQDNEPATPTSFVNSLPSGYAYGFNVNNLLSSLSVGYQDSISFSRLPIPFVCVAGDMVSSNAKNWGSGSLPTAMRSTMSIPGLFDPVRTDGMVLVDGGVRNNFPADIARAVGCDYVIGIELSDTNPGYSEIHNIGSILSQFITMLGKDAFSKTTGLTDVFIKPDLDGYNMLSFNAEAVDTMLLRGYRAAQGQHDGLRMIRERTGAAKPLSARKAVDLSRQSVRISSIDFEGLTEKEEQRLLRQMNLSAEEPLTKDAIDEAMAHLQASGAFESITYSLYGTGEPYQLVFHCTRSPIHRFSLGVRADSEEGAALLARVGLGVNKLTGSRLDVTARLSQNSRASVHYSLALGDLPTLNAAVSAAHYRGSLGSDKLRYDVSYSSLREQFYFSDIKWTRTHLRTGIAHVSYWLNPSTPFADQISEIGIVPLQGSELEIFAKGHVYTMDDMYFPTRGLQLNLTGEYALLDFYDPTYAPVLDLGLDFRMAIPISPRLTFLPDIRLRSIIQLDDDPFLRLSHVNFVGGALAGRYASDQIPFFGINHVLAMDDQLVDAVAELRFNPVGKFYISALGGLSFSEATIGELFTKPAPELYAFGLKAAYDTIVGPIKANVHWCNGQGWGAYISLGFDF